MSFRAVSSARVLGLLLLGASAACSGGQGETIVVHQAVVTADEESTMVQLLKVTDDGETLATEPLDLVGLGYGGLPFALGRGTMPEGQANVPEHCLHSQSLGLDAAGDCLVHPLLRELGDVVARRGLTPSDVQVTAIFDTGANDAYTPELVGALATVADDGAEAQGYQSEIVGDDPAAPSWHPADDERRDAYNHSGSIIAPVTNAKDWMGELKDEARLNELSIPGTHDTITYVKPSYGSAVQTQAMSLHTQLESGIRFLDIRLKCFRRANGEYDLFGFHGGFYEPIDLGEILRTIRAFLDAHRGEAIVARVRNEQGKYAKDNPCSLNLPQAGYSPLSKTSTFTGVLNAYVQRNRDLFWVRSDADYWYPKLGEIRGKIVVLSDYCSSCEQGPRLFPYWDERVSIQDDYHLVTIGDLYDKWKKVKAHLEGARAAASDPGRRLHINFLSGSTGATPSFVASGKSSPPTGAAQLLRISGCTKNDYMHREPDFPRVYSKSAFKCGSKHSEWAEVYFRGTNYLARDWLINASNRTDYTGIVVADFPGGDLIQQVIDVNRHTLRK